MSEGQVATQKGGLVAAKEVITNWMLDAIRNLPDRIDMQDILNRWDQTGLLVPNAVKVASVDSFTPNDIPIIAFSLGPSSAIQYIGDQADRGERGADGNWIHKEAIQYNVVVNALAVGSSPLLRDDLHRVIMATMGGPKFRLDMAQAALANAAFNSQGDQAIPMEFDTAPNLRFGHSYTIAFTQWVVETVVFKPVRSVTIDPVKIELEGL